MTESSRTGPRLWTALIALLHSGRIRLNATSLCTRLALLGALLTILATSLASLCVSIEIRKSTKRILVEGLARSQRAVLDQQKRDVWELLRTSSLITENPTMKAAIETYRSEASGAGSSRVDLLATVQNEADKIVVGLGKDLLIVTDERGHVLAASQGLRARPRLGTGLTSRGIIRQALRSANRDSGGEFAVLRIEGRYYQVGCVPILLQGFTIGTLTLGKRLDERRVRSLQEFLGGEAVVTIADQVVSSTLAGVSPADLPGAVTLASGPAAASAATGVVPIGKKEYVVASLSLGRDEAGRLVTLYLLDSLTEPMEEANRALRLILVSTGSAAAAVVGLVSWVMSRSVMRPLANFVNFLESTAETGDSSRRFRSDSASVEIKTLSEAYNRLMDSLSRTREQLSGAMEDLSNLDRLKEAEKMAALGRMLSGAAHEINNPLTGLVGNIELLLRRNDLDGTTRDRLLKARKAGQRVVTLVRNLLKVSRRTADERATVDLNQIIRETLELSIHDFTMAGVSAVLELKPAEILVSANALDLEQVFLNIIGNAYDALKETEGVLRLIIQTESDAGRAIVRFTDNGPGMREPAKVFEPFYTTKAVGKGTGLGLSISYGIIKEHGGEISATNVPQGGARFTIMLPLAEAHRAAASRPRESQSMKAGAVLPLAASVLVVDDEPGLLDFQAELLRSLGAQVVTAGSGAEAIERLGQRKFEVVISDLRMPGEFSGQDVYQWVEENQPDSVSNFIFVTGDTIGETTQAFLKRVPNHHLLKPFSIEDYVSTISEVLCEKART